MKTFCNQYKPKSLNKDPICFRNVNKPSCTDLFLTNNLKCFEIGLTDFHKLIVTIMKTKHERFLPKTVNYRDYKSFDTKTFKDRLELTLKNTTFFEQL